MKIIDGEFEYGKNRENELYYDTGYETEETEDILKSEKIRPYSSAYSLNPFTEKEQKFVWFNHYLGLGIGLVLNVEKLSERYKILYYSEEFENCRKHGINVHRVVAYSDGTYQANRCEIDSDIYEIIRNEFAVQPEEVIKEKNIIHSHKGKTKKKDVTIKESFLCNLRDVTLNIPAERFTMEQLYRICAKNYPIIFLKDDEEYLDVSECISGLYCNSRMYAPNEKIKNCMIKYLKPLCEKYHKNLLHVEEYHFPYITVYYTLCD